MRSWERKSLADRWSGEIPETSPRYPFVDAVVRGVSFHFAYFVRFVGPSAVSRMMRVACWQALPTLESEILPALNWLIGVGAQLNSRPKAGIIRFEHVTTNISSNPPPQFLWLKTGNNSFDEMLRAINSARNSVRLEMYIFGASAIGGLFREALCHAAERGVEVKVLVDAWGSVTLSDAFWEPLRRAGGVARWFNPISLDRYSIRNHRKLLVCDDDLGFVGGFNVATEYLGDGVREGWRDCGVSLRGPLARELAASFDTMFALADFTHKRFVRFRRSPLRRIIPTPEGELLLTGPGRGPNLLKRALLRDLRKATSVRILSAYFVPTRGIRRELIRAARRGCKVQLILAGKSDVPLMQSASCRFYPSYLNAGIEIYEYLPQILHAKLIVVDEVVYVGSANLDPRSFYINYELVLRLPNPGLAGEAVATFVHDLSLCRKIDSRTWRESRTFWSELKARWAYFLVARVDPFIARRQLRHLR